MMRRYWRALRGANSNESGTTLVELAIVGTFFFVLVFSIIDFGFLFYAKVTLQNAVRQAARYAITGNCTDGTGCFGNGTGNRYNTIVTTVRNFGFAVPPTNITVTCLQGSCPSYSNCGNQDAGNAGGPGDTVQVSASYTFRPVIIGPFLRLGFGSSSYPFTVSATFKNETFPPPVCS